MSTQEAWIPFRFYALMHVKVRSGLYELADKDEFTVYIGSAKNLRARIEEHLMESETSCIKQHAVLFRVEYRDDYELQEKHLRALFRNVFRRDPICN